MVFSSVTFLFLFLPITLLVYYAAPKTVRNIILLVASLLFYAWGEPVYLLLMLFSTIIAYLVGRIIDYYHRNNKCTKARISLICGLVIHIGILFFFKYANFTVDNINHLGHTNFSFPEIALPIGISFYTFQIISYLVDVFRGTVPVQKNWLHLALYIAFFPQLIAGPIVRYETIEHALLCREENMNDFASGVRKFIAGLGKKVLLADTFGSLHMLLSSLPEEQHSVLALWIIAIAYSLQIYYDFSGYSDMAIGLGRMFGFHFPENFHYPYIATNITDFWKRWHISLTSWFKDYVYIPLGGNRLSKWKHYRNIIIVWALTGLWHGAEWNFVVWGIYFCVLLIIEKAGLLKLLAKLPRAIQHLYTLLFVTISWSIFSTPDIKQLLITCKGMFGLNGYSLCNDVILYYIASYTILFIIALIGATPLPKRIYTRLFVTSYSVVQKTEISNSVIRGIFEILLIFLVLLISISALVSASFHPFLYFRF